MNQVNEMDYINTIFFSSNQYIFLLLANAIIKEKMDDGNMFGVE
jgi:hypothetical protein